MQATQTAPFQQKVDRINKALPTQLLQAMLILLGIVFIGAAILPVPNVIRATMIAYTILP